MRMERRIQALGDLVLMEWACGVSTTPKGREKKRSCFLRWSVWNELRTGKTRPVATSNESHGDSTRTGTTKSVGVARVHDLCRAVDACENIRMRLLLRASLPDLASFASCCSSRNRLWRELPSELPRRLSNSLHLPIYSPVGSLGLACALLIAGVLVDLYIPRHCAATGRLITSKDHASVQIMVADVDADGKAIKGKNHTYALCGEVRAMGEADDVSV